MKNLLMVALLTFCAFTATANDNSSVAKNEVLLKYIEKEYGKVIDIAETDNCTIITTTKYEISICGNLIESVWDVKSQNELDLPINKRNLDSEINSYYVYEMFGDDDGMYIQVSRIDGAHEYRFYFEEYYIEPTGEIVYYIGNEKLTIKNGELIYDNLTFKLLF